MGLIENEIRCLNEQPHRRQYLGTPYAKSRIFSEKFRFRLQGIKDSFRSGWIVESREGVNLYQVFTRLRSPNQINAQKLDPLRR